MTKKKKAVSKKKKITLRPPRPVSKMKQDISDDLDSMRIEDKHDMETLRFYKSLSLGQGKVPKSRKQAEALVDMYRHQDALRFANTILFLSKESPQSDAWDLIVRNAKAYKKLHK